VYILHLDAKCTVLIDFAILNLYTMSGYPWIGVNSFYRIKEDRTDIQGDSGEKSNNLGGDSMGYCKEKKLYGHVNNSEW